MSALYMKPWITAASGTPKSSPSSVLQALRAPALKFPSLKVVQVGQAAIKVHLETVVKGFDHNQVARRTSLDLGAQGRAVFGIDGWLKVDINVRIMGFESRENHVVPLVRIIDAPAFNNECDRVILRQYGNHWQRQKAAANNTNAIRTYLDVISFSVKLIVNALCRRLRFVCQLYSTSLICW